MDIENITLCPERNEYKKFINDPQSKNLDAKEYKKILLFFTEKYKLAFHNYFAEVFPYLRFEIGEEKGYWNYNTTSGVYEEVAQVTVKEWVIKLLIDERLDANATDVFAKTVLARYRAMYSDRGNEYDAFDIDDNWFHADNGWVCLTTNEFEPHTPERLSRVKSTVAYDANALCPTYDTFIENDLKLKADQVRVIDQFSGLCLTSDIRYQKMLTLLGRPGCGKSTLLDCWSGILGDKAIQRKLTELQGDSMRFAGSSFIGSTLCWFDEVDVKRAEMGNTLGTLITGTSINVERKGINGIKKARNTVKCVLTANKLPLTAEVGIYRRLIMIHIEGSFVDDGTAKVDMPDMLRSESSGILNRMIRGLQDLRKMRGFTLIAGHDELVEQYKAQSDTVAEFLDTYFIPGTDDDFIENEVLLASYRHFTDGNSWAKTITPQKFGRLLSTQPLNRFARIKSVQKNVGRGWSGLKVADEYMVNINSNIIVSKSESNF